MGKGLLGSSEVGYVLMGLLSKPFKVRGYLPQDGGGGGCWEEAQWVKRLAMQVVNV